MRIGVAFDHAGFLLKEVVIDTVRAGGHEVLDLGTFSTESVDYPDYALKLANLGYREAMKQDPALMKGLNVLKGNLMSKPVAEAQGLECAVIKL